MSKYAAGHAKGPYFGHFKAKSGHDLEASAEYLIAVIGFLLEGFLGPKIAYFGPV